MTTRAIAPQIEARLRAVAASGASALDEVASKRLIADVGIPVSRPVLATDADGAVQAARAIGFPVALKIVSAQILHKSNVGCVVLDVTDENGVRAAFATIQANARDAEPDAVIDGMGIEAMARPGLEVIVGLQRDPTFGPTVLFGLGGTLVELLDDVAMRVLPFDRADAKAMIDEIKGARLLHGFRDHPPRDVDAVVDIILAVGSLGEVAEIESVDLNPVIVYESGRGVLVVDAAVVLRTEGDRQGPAMDEPRTDLEALFNPASVAIVGASNNLAKLGGRLTKYLLERDYGGQVYLVNNRETEIAGRPVYPKLADVPGDIDLVVLSVPVAALDTVIGEMAGKNVRFALVNASGFAEAGAEGKALQDRLLHSLRAEGIRLCGPNTIGVFSPVDSFFAAFSPSMEAPRIPVGSIGFITQSGALGGSLLTRAWRDGVGFSRCVSSGNEADLTTADYIDYFVADPSTRVISVFLEGVNDGRRFRASLDNARAAGVPVLVYKNGRSEVGARAVQSHTGSLAGSGKVYDSVLAQAGAIRLSRVSHLYEVALAFDRQPLPTGNRVGIVSTSGGACTVLADRCADAGVEVPELTPETTATLGHAIPDFGSARNPVDVTAQVGSDPLLMANSIATVLEDENVDAVIVMLTTLVGSMAAAIARGVADAVRGARKPVLAVWTIAPEMAAEGFAILQDDGLPVYQDPETAVAALSAMSRVAASRRRDARCSNQAQEG